MSLGGVMECRYPLIRGMHLLANAPIEGTGLRKSTVSHSRTFGPPDLGYTTVSPRWKPTAAPTRCPKDEQMDLYDSEHRTPTPDHPYMCLGTYMPFATLSKAGNTSPSLVAIR